MKKTIKPETLFSEKFKRVIIQQGLTDLCREIDPSFGTTVIANAGRHHRGTQPYGALTNDDLQVITQALQQFFDSLELQQEDEDASEEKGEENQEKGLTEAGQTVVSNQSINFPVD